MAGKGAVLALRIVSDAKGATAGLRDTEKAVGGFQQKLDKASVAAGGVLAAVGGVAKEAFDAASDLQQAGGAVETIYGRQTAAVEAYAAKSADAMGLSSRAYKEGAALIGAQLKGLGFDVGDAVKKQNELQQRAADLAATFGGSTSDAVDALSSALKGERDPIERYGVQLNQAGVDAKVAALGLDTSTAASKKHAEALATLALIQDQTAATAGTFNRELDTAAGSSAVASAKFEEAKAALGEVLLPVVADAMNKFAGLSGWLVRNKDTVIPLVMVVTGLAGAVLAVNGAVRTYFAIARAVTAVQWLLNAAMAANPIGLIVLGVAALVAGFVLAYQKVEWFRNLIQDLWKWIKKAWNVVGGFITGGGHDGSGWSAPAAATAGAPGLYGAAAGAVAAPAGLYGAPMTALDGGRSTAVQGPGTVNVTVQVGVGDPVAIGRELEKILRKFAQATGQDVALTVGARK